MMTKTILKKMEGAWKSVPCPTEIISYSALLDLPRVYYDQIIDVNLNYWNIHSSELPPHKWGGFLGHHPHLPIYRVEIGRGTSSEGNEDNSSPRFLILSEAL